jgi:ABC-2 type transport system permease protein
MNRTYLIARQEFIKYITRRGFFISLLVFPLWITLAVFVPRWMAGTLPERAFTIVDHAGGYEAMLRETLDRNLARKQLLALSDYAYAQTDMNAFGRAHPELTAMLAKPSAKPSLEQFRNGGGVKPVLTALTPFRKRGAPPFVTPQPHFVAVPAPAPLYDASPDAFDTVAGDYLNGDTHKDLAPRWHKLTAIVVIPKDFGAGSTSARFLSSDTGNAELADSLQQALTSALRLHAARALLPSGTAGAETLDVSADMETNDPTRSGDKKEAMARTVADYLPVGLAFLLFVVSMMNASVLLQGVIEEKSTRMIEVLLSCAAPRQILIGKLIGVIAVSLVTILAWGLMLLLLAVFAGHDAIATVSSAVSAVLGVSLLPLILVYFLCQILIYGAIFLAIGSMAASLADAQALLGPAMLFLILPNLLIGGILQDPSGDVARYVSWIPIYTPFLMLVRLPSHPPAIELAATAAFSVVTTAAMIWMVGRIFERNVLTTERPPSFRALLRRAVGR